MSRVWGVIPARWASSRFPGKMLHPVCGRPLLAWVVEQARKARRLEGVLVATDDSRIMEAAATWGVEVVMTEPALPSGTDRVAAAVRGRPVDAVVNVQGDEPLIDPDLIDALADAVIGVGNWDMATAAAPIREEAERLSPSVVKVVCDATDRALYFSRATIPHVRDPEDASAVEHWRHIGVYAYRADFLERLVREPVCALEKAEKLEQLRALHLGARIRVLQTDSVGVGVDTPEDVPRAEALLRRAGRGEIHAH